MKGLWKGMTLNERDTAIYLDFEEGMTYKELAEKYCLSKTRIKDIVRYEQREYERAIDKHKEHVQEIKEFRSRYPGAAMKYPATEQRVREVFRRNKKK